MRGYLVTKPNVVFAVILSSFIAGKGSLGMGVSKHGRVTVDVTIQHKFIDVHVAALRNSQGAISIVSKLPKDRKNFQNKTFHDIKNSQTSTMFGTHSRCMLGAE